MIISNLDNWNIKKVSEIKNYLMESIDHNRYHTFSLGELLLLDFAIANYSEILLITQHWDSLSSQYYGYPPVEDNFYRILAKIIIDKKATINKNLEEIVVSYEQEQFLKLLLDALLSAIPELSITQEQLNKQGKAFLETFTVSPYRSFVEENILFELETARGGFGFFIGSGHSFLSGSTSNFIDPYTPAMLGLDVPFDRWLFTMRLIGGGGGIIDGFNWNGTDYTRDQFRLNPLLVTLGAGFAIINLERFRLYPMISIGGFSVSPVDEDEELDLSSFAYGGGILMDIVLWKWNNTSSYIYGSNMNNEVGLRLSYETISHHFSKVTPTMEGRYSAAGLSVYWIFRGLRRKTY
jgi:hypothetical protein